MAENALPKDMAGLLTAIDLEWVRLQAVIARLDPKQMITPDSGGWSPKDNLAHLAAWMRFMQDCYLDKKPAHEALGMDLEIFRGLDETGINAMLFERNRDRSAADVLAGLKRTYREVLQALGKMDFADLMKPVQPDDPEKRPVILWVLGNTSEHFVEHRQTIERSL